ncbi:MAG: hypothetical protein IKT46_09395 [Clostridia bacterium]|nr:hypothetical protein [Clostridia bacterium]
MMKCTFCGVDLEDGAQFCTVCGNSVEIPKAALFISTPEEIESATQNWNSVVGVDTTLSFNGKKIIITADKDKFNAFRKRIIRLAKYCSDRAAEDYIENIKNLTNLLENFPDLYVKHARLLANKVTDILVAENIYTVTDDMVMSQFENSTLSAMEILSAISDNINEIYQANNQVANIFAGLAGSFIGSKSSFGGEVFGAMQDGLVAGASTLSETQQKQLFESIDCPDLFNRVYNDYQDFAIILIDLLNMNGVDSWKPDFEPSPQMDNILKNLSNPNFPQDRITDIVIDMIAQKPYKPEIYTFLQSKYADNEEVKNIVEYFGFADYKTNVYTEDDFPKPEVIVPQTPPAPQTQQIVQPQTEQQPSVPNNNTPSFGAFKKLGSKIDEGIGKAESFFGKFGKK